MGIRQLLQQYTRRFMDAARGRGYFASQEESNQYVQSVKYRLLPWSASRACRSWEALVEARTLKDVAVDKAVQQFALAPALEESSLLELFTKLKSAATSPDRIQEIRMLIDQYRC